MGITIWADGGGGRVEPVEHGVWLDARHASPLGGADYSHVSTRAASTARGQAWTLQDLPHRPGHPRARLLHVIGCHPGTPLTLGQALDALRRPRTVACHICKAATSLPTPA
ncbi:DUF6233 domain-containing protein [Streptomyces sp. NPDC051577]|uniref:DUF6233 domain-containing protein n=1 Tax=Streptomyces sp. NPDC051577 TaxID=3155166 RepID=UPI0034357027